MIPHVPVLREEVVEAFGDTRGTVIDATLGYGGHTEALLESNPHIRIIGIDRDQEAIDFSTKRLAPYANRVRILKGRFGEVVPKILAQEPVAGILADIGVSSLQLDKKERGFSLASDTLDMRMDKEAELSAYQVVNEYAPEELARVLREYGEIRNAKRVAEHIVSHRPITSAKELAHIAAQVLPKTKKIHPATTLLQAIRIEVNQELRELESLLDAIETYTPKGATIAIITFHSLEDRIVKNRFKKWAKKCVCPPESMRCECGGDRALGVVVTKKPITASAEELARNPRARSAKLRIFRIRDDI